jgi:hypothetical protein
MLVPRVQARVAGAWQDWTTGSKPGAPEGAPTTARHKKDATVVFGHEKTAEKRLSACSLESPIPMPLLNGMGEFCPGCGVRSREGGTTFVFSRDGSQNPWVPALCARMTNRGASVAHKGSAERRPSTSVILSGVSRWGTRGFPSKGALA